MFGKATRPSRPRRSRLLVAVVALGLLGGGSHFTEEAAAQALPPSLQGEEFIAFEGSTGQSGQIDLSAVCDPRPGGTFTASYTASGEAVGPYTGTFTETGTMSATLTTATGGPVEVGGPAASGPVVTWEAQFTIDSPTGQVTGTKTFSGTFSNAFCLKGTFNSGRYDHAFAFASLTYQATITTGDGQFRDSGDASASVTDFFCERCFVDDPLFVRYFSESFQRSSGVLPVDTSGKATGGGQIVSTSNPAGRVTFGFNVRKSEDGSRLQGTCNVLDHSTGTHVKCLTVTNYQQIGNTATWQGQAKVNGVVQNYQITVQDNGEPNRGVDTFLIDTASYDAGGPVTHGNVQIHKQGG